MSAPKPDIRERARAARELLSRRDALYAAGLKEADRKELEVAAFVAIFHPDHVLPRGERYTEDDQ